MHASQLEGSGFSRLEKWPAVCNRNEAPWQKLAGAEAFQNIELRQSGEEKIEVICCLQMKK